MSKPTETPKPLEPAIIEKVRKLLKLATSDNPHEAAAAAGKAQRLIEQHRIDGALLAEDAAAEGRETPSAPIVQEKILEFSSVRIQPWTFAMARAVCSANACRWWFHRGWKETEKNKTTGERRKVVHPAYLEAAGTSENLAVVRFLLGHLVAEVERLATASLLKGEAFESGVDATCRQCEGDGNVYGKWGLDTCPKCKGKGRQTETGARAGQGRRWANSFRLGASQEIANRLYAASKEERQRAKDEAKKTREEMYRDACDQLAQAEAREARAAEDVARGDLDPLDLAAFVLAVEEARDRFRSLDRDQEKGASPGTALVRVEGALARLDAEKDRTEEWVKVNVEFKGRGYSGREASDARAFGKGKEAGATVDLKPAKHKLGGGA